VSADLRATIAAVRDDGRARNVRCPAHDDHRASLSIGRGGDGRVLLHCHTGCSAETILQSASLTWSDVMGANAPSVNRLTAQIAGTYDYLNARGDLVFQVVRFSPKDFRQRRPDGKGGWIWSTAGVRPVLYHLDQLQKLETVVVVEGEKDVDELWALNLPATCNAGGAGKWRDDHTRQLLEAGVQAVAIIPDNDEPGRRHAEAVARSCHEAGLRVQVVELPGLPPKGDVSDWLAVGHSRDELIALAQGPSLYTPRNDTPTFALTSIGDLLAEPDEQIDWLVEERIPAGGVVILAAKPKVGKSTTARDLALAVARGESWLEQRCHAGPAWYLAFEGRRRDVRAHFRQMGAQPSDPLRIFVGQAPRDVVTSVRQLAESERPVLIIIDTMQRFLRAGSTDDYAEMTTLLDAVIAIAQQSGATMVLLHHAGKGDRAGIDTVLGSTAIAGSADTIILLARTERFRTIQTVQRVGEDLPETLILLDETTGRVHLGGSRKDAELQNVAAAILTVLRSAATPLTEPQIVELVDARTTLQRRALRELVAREQVLRAGRGGKGSPYTYYVSDACSLVPLIGGEQASKDSRSHDSSQEPVGNACSLVFEQDTCSRTHIAKPAIVEIGVVESSDPSDCPVCGRDACDDVAACLRQRHRGFADFEDVFGPFERVTVERLH
jgi:hypothetical protein